MRCAGVGWLWTFLLRWLRFILTQSPSTPSSKPKIIHDQTTASSRGLPDLQFWKQTVLHRDLKDYSSPVKTLVKRLFFRLELVSFSGFDYVPVPTHQDTDNRGVSCSFPFSSCCSDRHMLSLIMATRSPVKGWEWNMLWWPWFSYKKLKQVILWGEQIFINQAGLRWGERYIQNNGHHRALL